MVTIAPNALSELQRTAPFDVVIENRIYSPLGEEDNYSLITPTEIRVGWGDANVLLSTDLQDRIYSMGIETCSALCGLTETGDFILAHNDTYRIKDLFSDEVQEAIAQNRAGKIDLRNIIHSWRIHGPYNLNEIKNSPEDFHIRSTIHHYNVSYSKLGEVLAVTIEWLPQEEKRGLYSRQNLNT